MEYIRSKDIFLLMGDILKLIHPRPMEHGAHVAYIVYKMLAEEGKYEEFELADIVFVACMHDIGAYKTEYASINDILSYEANNSKAHAIYGYLFFKYLSPVPELAKVIMYHHMDYDQLQKVDYQYKEIAAYIHIAENMDIFSSTMGNTFDITIFQKQAGTRYSPSGLERFYQCETKYGILQKLKNGEYKKELSDIVEYMIFNNEDKKKFLEMVMYCLGFRSESTVVDTITTICICEELAKSLEFSALESEILYYSALIHDIGMLAIPREIIEAPRKLEPEEIQLLRTHVEITGNTLNDRMKNEVVSIALAHHERCDGSGYPLKLQDFQMTASQKILQVADTVSAMINKRSYRDPLPKEKVIAILNEEAARHRLKKHIVASLVSSYDQIFKKVADESAEIIKMYQTLNLQYKLVSQKYKI